MDTVARLLLGTLLLAWSLFGQAQTPNLERGRQLYLTHCAACHGNSPIGVSPATVADDPQGLGLAISRQPAMNFLGPLLNAQARVDLTAWIGSVVFPQTLPLESGWYWNAAESGRGFFFERRPDDHVFMAAFHYTASGAPLWFVAQGEMVGNRFMAAMLEFQDGQSLTGAYRAPTPRPSPGTLTWDYLTGNTVRMTWPGGTVNLVRFPFATGSVQAPPQAGAPESGWWWNPAEGGRGFAIEFQGNQMFLCGFLYENDGPPLWLASNGAMATPTSYVGQLLRFADGQAMGAAYRAPRLVDPMTGELRMQFSSPTRGVMILPDGRNIPLERFPF